MVSQFENLMRFFTLLKNHGIEDAIISPGSRNAPLIKCLYDLNFKLLSSIDERSAGFIALGMAKATGKPVVVCSTSGTATLNYHPAIAEAYYARIPLMVITADRPFEQIDQWEGQSIRQNRLFENHIRFQCQLDPQSSYTNPDKLAAEIIDVFNEIIPGPIHINVPLSEPLYAFEYPTTKIESHDKEISIMRSPVVVSSGSIQHYLGKDWTYRNVLFFHGMDGGENISFDTNGQVVFSDATSSMKGSIKFWDSLLNVSLKGGKLLSNLQPDILVTCGTTTISKALKVYLRHFPPAEHFHISYSNEVGKMFNTEPIIIHPNDLKERVKESSNKSNYLYEWSKQNKAFEERFDDLPWSTFSAFSAVHEILNNLPEKTTIHAANSMAVRYLSFLGHPIIGNRGTSGIDGCTSTAVGYALRSPDKHLLITGDLAFFYDANGLWLNNLPINLKIVVLNNGGGGIFKMIEGPEAMLEAIEYQVTNHQRSVKSLAEHFGLPYLCISDSKGLEEPLKGWLAKDVPGILEIKTSQSEDQYFYSLFNNLRL